FRRRDAFFNERVPLVALGALPQQLGTAVAATHADVGVEVEDGVPCQAQVPVYQLRRSSECRDRLPDLLVDDQGVGVVAERLEQEFECARRVAGGKAMAP